MLKVKVYNSTLDEDEVVKIISKIENDLGTDNQGVLEISFVSSDEISKMNTKFLEKEGPTDVLSFPQIKVVGEENLFGSIVICKEEADRRGVGTEELIKHGFLHLTGFDHETDKEAWLTMTKKINHKDWQ